MCNDMKYVKYGNNVRGGRDGLHELSVIVRDSREFSGLSRLWRGHSVHLPDWTRPDNNVSGLDIDWPTDQGAVVNAAKLPLTPQPASQPAVCMSVQRHYARRHKWAPLLPQPVPYGPAYYCTIVPLGQPAGTYTYVRLQCQSSVNARPQRQVKWIFSDRTVGRFYRSVSHRYSIA